MIFSNLKVNPITLYFVCKKDETSEKVLVKSSNYTKAFNKKLFDLLKSNNYYSFIRGGYGDAENNKIEINFVKELIKNNSIEIKNSIKVVLSEEDTKRYYRALTIEKLNQLKELKPFIRDAEGLTFGRVREAILEKCYFEPVHSYCLADDLCSYSYELMADINEELNYKVF